ncbi:TPA: hypothetical protein I7768_12310 [Vibrio vulnificus]|nr:hypothetical protein [Vibrio vulnificus]
MLPKQVHLRCVLLTSYCFLQTLPLASNALAIRIIFPSVRAIRASFNPTGLPASLGKRKRLAIMQAFSFRPIPSGEIRSRSELLILLTYA